MGTLDTTNLYMQRYNIPINCITIFYLHAKMGVSSKITIDSNSYSFKVSLVTGELFFWYLWGLISNLTNLKEI